MEFVCVDNKMGFFKNLTLYNIYISEDFGDHSYIIYDDTLCGLAFGKNEIPDNLKLLEDYRNEKINILLK